MITFIVIVILIYSIIIHEVSHGLMADRLGDPTARREGRLTLNPLKHIDPVGSILVPLMTYYFGGFAFGWAKPVPFNPYNLKNRKLGEFLIALAGPSSNLSIALIFGLIIRYLATMSPMTATISSFIDIASQVVIINIILALFNLIPLPPLDGSKLLFSLLPDKYFRVRSVLEAYAPVWILLVVLFIWQFISPIIPFVFKIFTGLTVGM